MKTNTRSMNVSTNPTKKRGYFSRLLAAIVGRETPPAPVTTVAGDEGRFLELRSRAAALEMDLRERDEQIAQMKAEYESLEAAKEKAEATAGEGQLERLYKALSGPLANLATLATLAETGQQVEITDLLSLVRSLEEKLVRAGLEPIGHVGEQAPFDVTAHQRMSGGAVGPGTPVTVQLPGYRMGEKVLMKAMVSSREDAPRQEHNNG
jgi:molecular chaperone GrpE (heat shock protein)